MPARFLEIATPQCSADEFDGEIVAVNVETGIYHSLKGGAALLWRDLAAGHSVDSLLAMAQVQDGLSESIGAFADDLVANGLMRPVSAVAEPSAPLLSAASIGTMAPPLLESFGDMQSLLLLDPVHEVDEEIGWPTRPV